MSRLEFKRAADSATNCVSIGQLARHSVALTARTTTPVSPCLVLLLSAHMKATDCFLCGPCINSVYWIAPVTVNVRYWLMDCSTLTDKLCQLSYVVTFLSLALAVLAGKI